MWSSPVPRSRTSQRVRLDGEGASQNRLRPPRRQQESMVGCRPTSAERQVHKPRVRARHHHLHCGAALHSADRGPGRDRDGTEGRGGSPGGRNTDNPLCLIDSDGRGPPSGATRLAQNVPGRPMAFGSPSRIRPACTSRLRMTRAWCSKMDCPVSRPHARHWSGMTVPRAATTPWSSNRSPMIRSASSGGAMEWRASAMGGEGSTGKSWRPSLGAISAKRHIQCVGRQYALFKFPQIS